MTTAMTDQFERNFVDLHRRMDKIDEKMDKMVDTITKLVVIEERMVSQGQRIGLVENRVTAVEAKTDNMRDEVNSYKNRIWGVCIALTGFFAVINWLFNISK